jgi:hypothetical protein
MAANVDAYRTRWVVPVERDRRIVITYTEDVAAVRLIVEGASGLVLRPDVGAELIADLQAAFASIADGSARVYHSHD